MNPGAEIRQETPGPSLRERILSAAFDAFMEGGYGGASTSDIARRARVSKRDLYAQFGSKQAMLAACISERAERMRLPLELPAPCNQAVLAAALVTFGRTLLREVSRPEVLAMYRLAILEAERSPDVAQTLDSLGHAKNLSALMALMLAAQQSGLLGAAAPAMMAEYFLAVLWRGGLLVRMLLRVAAAPDAAEVEQRARFAAESLTLRFAPL